MEEALRTLIVSASGVTDLVSTRVYWRQAPQSVGGDFINLHRVGGVRDYNMQGASGLVDSRVQVDCWADRYSSAKMIARAVETVVSGYSGTIGGKRLQGIFIDAERDDDTSDSGDVATRFRTSLDLLIWHD
jgi:hypothetical protein